MKVYTGRGLGDIYYELARDIAKNGREIVTRGKRCLELPEPVTLVYDSPGYCMMNISERKFNPFFALVEVPWILSGNGNVDWISYFNSNMRLFSDPGEENFHGSYGLRIRKWEYVCTAHKPPCDDSIDQIQYVVRKLREDPFTRQAVICLWDPVRDNLEKSNDIPCNNIIYYSLRNGILDQTVVIRSNDLVWGTPHNAIQFTHLHALIAGILEVRMGTFTYVVQNLHYYLDLYNPTLGHILNAAHEQDAVLVAEKLDSFEPATEEFLAECVDQIDYMMELVKTGHKLYSQRKLRIKDMRFLKPGYWGFVIPQLIWIYILVKEGLMSSANDIEALAKIASDLPKPLPALIYDFWKDSTNPFAKELAYALGQSGKTAGA